MPGSNELSLGWVYTLLAAIGILGGVGDVWVYKWAKTNRTFWVVAACIVHVASVVLFGLLLKWDSRAFCAAFMLTSVVHVVIVIAADVLFFGGELTPTEWAGMALAFVSVVLLEVGRKEGPPNEKPEPSAETRTGETDGDRP